MKELRGQATVEYLLITGGVLLVALVVGAYMTTAASKIYNSVTGVSGATLKVNPEPGKLAYWVDDNTLGGAGFLSVDTLAGTLNVGGTVTANKFCIGSSCVTSWNSSGVTDTRCDTLGTCSQLCIGTKCITSWNEVNYVSGGGGSTSTPWHTSGSNIYYNGGYVGIGTTNPQYTLDVAGKVRINGDMNLGGSPMTIYIGKSTKIIAEPRNSNGDRDIWFQSSLWLANVTPGNFHGGTLVLSAQPPYDFTFPGSTTNTKTKRWALTYDVTTNNLRLIASKGTGNWSNNWYDAMYWGMNGELNVNANVDVNGTVAAKKICIGGNCKTSWPGESNVMIYVKCAYLDSYTSAGWKTYGGCSSAPACPSGWTKVAEGSTVESAPSTGDNVLGYRYTICSSSNYSQCISVRCGFGNHISGGIQYGCSSAPACPSGWTKVATGNAYTDSTISGYYETWCCR